MVADRIEFHLGETGGGEFRGKLGLKLGILKAGRFLRGNLDEGPCAEVPYADDPEAMAADSLLGFFDGSEAIGGYGEAGGKPRGKAGRSGVFGNFQAGLSG